jgi:hypothetical protein
MTKPHDQYARLLLDQMLSGYGSVLEEFPLSPSPPRAVDLVFVPRPTSDADAIPLGALAPLSTTACLVCGLTPSSRRHPTVLWRDVRAANEVRGMRAPGAGGTWDARAGSGRYVGHARREREVRGMRAPGAGGTGDARAGSGRYVGCARREREVRGMRAPGARGTGDARAGSERYGGCARRIE